MSDTTINETGTDATGVELRAWVGCLACYNAGRLVGDWVAGVDAAEFVPCERPGHEEWWCLDLEGYGELIRGECSPAEAQAVAELVGECESVGVPVDVLRAWVGNMGELPSSPDDVAEVYLGEWESVEHYAGEFIADCGLLDGVPDLVERYFDLAGFARDLVLGGDIWVAECPGGVLVFGNG